MPSTTNYFANLKLQAESAALAKKQALDTAYNMATGATVNKDTGEITYGTDASGNKKLGSVDVAYEEQKRQTATGGEASGMLRSGQLARQKINEESDYRSKIMGLAADTAAQKSQIDLDTSTKVAEYQALYGSTGAGGTSASSSTSSSSNKNNDFKPITPTPDFPSGSTPKPAYQDPSIRNRATTTAPVKGSPQPVAKPTTKPTPKKTAPKRIGGL